MTSARFWHGGAPGRKAGDLLLPPSVTGVRSRRQDAEELQMPRITQRLDLVYFTTERNLARACAGLWNDYQRERIGGGALYQVEPIGDLEVDPDLPMTPPISFAAAGAQVVAVVDAHVARDDRRFGPMIQRYLDQIE